MNPMQSPNTALPTILPIDDISKFEGSIPSGYDLVEYKEGQDPLQGYILYGFDEADPRNHHAFVRL